MEEGERGPVTDTYRESKGGAQLQQLQQQVKLHLAVAGCQATDDHLQRPSSRVAVRTYICRY